MSLHPDIPASEATSVTHFLCPDGPTRNGVPDTTHHLVPRSTGTGTYQQVCTYCGRSEAQLRAMLLKN